MRKLFLVAPIALVLAACQGGTLDELTGTTLEERCFYRQGVVAELERRQEVGEELSLIEERVLESYRSYVNVVCAGIV